MGNGGDLSMCIKGCISEKNPLAKLIEDPYAFGILNPEVDFEVELMESNIENKYLLFKRKFDSSIGYVLVFYPLTKLPLKRYANYMEFIKHIVEDTQTITLENLIL